MDLLVVLPSANAKILSIAQNLFTTWPITVRIVSPEEARNVIRTDIPKVCFVFANESTPTLVKILGYGGSYPVLVIGRTEDEMVYLRGGANAFISIERKLSSDLLLAHYTGLQSLSYPTVMSQRPLQNCIYSYRGILLNQELRSITYQGTVCTLPLKNYKILFRLIEADGERVSQKVLIESVWGKTKTTHLRTLATHIGRLRILLSHWENFLIEGERGYYRFLTTHKTEIPERIVPVQTRRLTASPL